MQASSSQFDWSLYSQNPNLLPDYLLKIGGDPDTPRNQELDLACGQILSNINVQRFITAEVEQNTQAGGNRSMSAAAGAGPGSTTSHGENTGHGRDSRS